jgi:hypothetical protein
MGALAIQRRSVVWNDAQGRTRQTILRGQESVIIVPTLATVASDLQSLSNGAIQTAWEGDEQASVGTAVNAQYPVVSDYAVLVYADANGNKIYITLPAPQASVFLADGETVDPAAIATLSGDVIGLIVTNANMPVVTFIGGFRRKNLQEYQ